MAAVWIYFAVFDQISANYLSSLRYYLFSALLAAVSLGALPVQEIPAHVAIANTFKPQAQNRALYDELFAAYLEIYKANQKIYARLNRQRINGE